MKKIFAILLVVALIFSLAACSESASKEQEQEDTSAVTADTTENTNENQEEQETKSLKIGFSANSLDDYMTTVSDAFIAYCENLGHSVILLNANSNTNQQLTDVENLIAQQCDIIVVRGVDSEGVIPAIEAVVAAGIPVIEMSALADTWANLHVRPDYDGQGAAQGNFIAQYLDEHPDETLKCGYFWGTKGMLNTQAKYDSFIAVVQPYIDDGRFEIIVEKDCEWSTDKAVAAMEDWMIAYPEMNCVATQNDEMALGVTQVLQAAQADFDEWVIVSIDGTASGRNEVKEGRIDETGWSSRTGFGEDMAKATISIAEGRGEYEENSWLNAGLVEAVTIENVDEYEGRE